MHRQAASTVQISEQLGNNDFQQQSKKKTEEKKNKHTEEETAPTKWAKKECQTDPNENDHTDQKSKVKTKTETFKANGEHQTMITEIETIRSIRQR